MIINKIIFDRFDFADKKCKFINHKKNILKNSIIINFRKSNKIISVNKHEHRIRENSL